MKVTLLGVGGSAGLPQIGGADGFGDWGKTDPSEPKNRRTRSSIVIESAAGKRILVDTSPDLRLQLTGNGIGRIDAVIYTHTHADHVAGLDEIRILNRLLAAPMPAYALAENWTELRARFEYAFRPYSGGFFGRPVLAPQVIDVSAATEIAGLSVRWIDQDHGYGRSLGLRVGDFAYCTDVVRFDDAALAGLQGLELFVVDCFTPGKAHPTHANLAQVLEWVRVLKPGRTVLTHMGPEMDYASLLASLPESVQPGYDGMVLTV